MNRSVGSIVEALAYHAQERPDRLCIVDEQGENTYQSIWELTLKCVKGYEKYGIAKSDSVVVECTQDARFLVCAFACQLAGAIFVPIENKATKERTKEILEETKAGLFLYAGDACGDSRGVEITAFFEETAALVLDESSRKHRFGRAADISEILYTTGTTGKPRGIVLTNENNVAIAENIRFGVQMKADSVELIPLPLSHSHGLRTCYADILNGSTVVLVNGVMNVKRIFSFLDTYQVSALDLSPNAAKVLLKLSKGEFSKYAAQIDFVQIGTAMLDETLKDELCEVFCHSRLYNFYGSTESGRVCVLDFHAERGRAGCIGKPAKHAVFIVVDEDKQRIDSSKEHMGLLAIAGKMNMKRYMGSDELTREVLQNGYIYTNDVGYMDEDGYVYVLGRNDDVINYKGIKVVPEEIEAYVMKYKGVVDCACVAAKDDLCGTVPKVFVAVEDEKSFEGAALLKFLADYVEVNKMPKLIEVIDEIPRTSNGKLLRRKLRN